MSIFNLFKKKTNKNEACCGVQIEEVKEEKSSCCNVKIEEVKDDDIKQDENTKNA